MQSSFKPRFEKVIIICPENITGGPEALHQLGHVINGLGGLAVMAYYGAQNLQVSNNHLIGMSSPGDAFRSHYQCYKPIIEDTISLNEKTLVIFPEIFPMQALQFRWSQRAIWWLSVDNALNQSPPLGYKSSSRGIFQDDTLLHFYQSFYAFDYLRQQGARQVMPLFDYVARDYQPSHEVIAAKLNSDETRKVALFPRKGADLAKVFINTAPHLSYSLIEGMTRDQVGQALLQSSVYIDFGHQPGKDRVPREAALSGNIVFLHEKGAALHYGDFPIDNHYLFTTAEVQSGKLRTRVAEALADFSDHFARQAVLRQKVVMEQREFEVQVACSFFASC